MTTEQIVAFQIHPVPADVLAQVGARGVDAVSGTPVEHLVAEGGEPLRCCLRDADPGEDVMLFGYEPPLPTRPTVTSVPCSPMPNSARDRGARRTTCRTGEEDHKCCAPTTCGGGFVRHREHTTIKTPVW